MLKPNPLLWAAVSGLLTVAFGAFGAHALRGHVTPELLSAFQTGVQYQGLHTMALLCVGLLAQRNPDLRLDLAGWAFLVGTALFSGSLYLLALTEYRPLGLITPFGGMAFLAGWYLLARFSWGLQRADQSGG